VTRLRTLFHIVSAVGLIVGLMAVVAGVLYAFCCAVLFLVGFVPVIGRRHRHARWDELTKRSGRASDATDGVSAEPQTSRES
jgi:hypothetical protein